MEENKKEVAKAEKEAAKKVKEEAKVKEREEAERARREEAAWKEAERLSKAQAEKERKEAEARAREQQKAMEEADRKAAKAAKDRSLEEERQVKLKRENRGELVKKLGTQKPGRYTIKILRQDTKLAGGIEAQIREIGGLHIKSSGGSSEGILYSILMDEPADLLLTLTDLPTVEKVRLDHNVISVSIKSG